MVKWKSKEVGKDGLSHPITGVNKIYVKTNDMTEEQLKDFRLAWDKAQLESKGIVLVNSPMEFTPIDINPSMDRIKQTGVKLKK